MKSRLICLYVLLFSFALSAQTNNITIPVFGDGYATFKSYVKEHLEITQAAKDASFSGEVKVVFRVSKFGLVDSIFIEGDDEYGLIEPIKYILESAEKYKWTPAKRKGEVVEAIIHEVFVFSPEMRVFIPPTEFVLDYTGARPLKLIPETYLSKLKSKLTLQLKKNRRLIKKKANGIYECHLYKSPQSNLKLKLIKGQGDEINQLIETIIKEHNQMFEIILEDNMSFSARLIVDFSNKTPIIKMVSL